MLSSSEAEEVEGGPLELQQLFLDLAALVESQGVRVGDVERHVAAAAEEVGAAEGELREARQLQGTARRRRMWLIVGRMALLLVTLAVVVALALARRNGRCGVAGGEVRAAAGLTSFGCGFLCNAFSVLVLSCGRRFGCWVPEASHGGRSRLS